MVTSKFALPETLMYNFPIDVPFADEIVHDDRPLKTKQQKQLSVMSEKLEDLRRISNVIQALDNLASQCADAPAFNAIKAYAEYQLGDLRRELQQQIHA